MFDASPGPSAPAETRRLSPSLAATVGGRQLSPQGQPYWFDERIHSFGNGRFSAFFAPLATRIIDKFSYGGIDVRGLIHASLPKDASVVDLCCGVGYSTMPGATGVDTSKAFLGMGGLLRPDVTFCEGNAETWGEPFSHDVVTLMFATHEMPREARQRVLANAARIARRQVVVVDIDPEFKLALTRDPSRQTQARAFLDGEPYVMDYLAAIDDDVEACARSRGWQAATDRPIPGHVKRWTLTRATPSNGRAPAAQPQPASPWLYPTPRGESSGALDWGI